MIPKNQGEKFSSGLLYSEFSWGVVSRYAANLLIVALSPGHGDIMRFHPWSQFVTGSLLDCDEKIPNLLRRLATLTFFIPVQAFPDPLCGELLHDQIFINNGPNLLT